MAKRHAKSYHEAVAYFQAHNVRVANMSWGWSYKEIESILEANGIGDDTEDRQQRAKEILGILDDGLFNAMKSAPEILFVSAAGNSDSDVAFDKVIPSAYELPNLLIVGAVDQAGERTSFTSSGENVLVYSNGFEVESYVPGGKRMAMSGTSMSSPNAANLAAKLIAVKPDLTPEQVIVIIKKSADSLTDQPDLLLMNPKAAMGVLEKQS
jgi:subtilisin family serine protease